MSSVTRKPRRLERYRGKPAKRPAERQGAGRARVREAKALALREALLRKKVTSRAMREFDALALEELRTKLGEARKELFTLRFRQATTQLENSAALPAARRRIARILTLIKQKEVGAYNDGRP
jgi:large subunit ribosomal protein L29